MYKEYSLSHIGFLVWLIHQFGYEPIKMKDIGDKTGKRLEAIRYHIVALEDGGLINIDRRHRPHVISVNEKKWLDISLPKKRDRK